MTDRLTYRIRQAAPEEYERVGHMTVSAYAELPGMPGPAEQPDYYAMLRDTGARADRPGHRILVAVGTEGNLLGAVTFVGEMAAYNAGGSAWACADAAGIRLLAVRPRARNRGVGTALTRACLELARDLGRGRVVLHTTKAMELAWKMYEQMGFIRFPDLDFLQGSLQVYGFSMTLDD